MTAVEGRTIITEPGVYDIPEHVYHADPVPGGSLSSSGARKLLPPSCPALFRYEQDNPPEPKDYFNLGSAAHKLVLGIGADIVEVKADSWRTNAAQAARDDARAADAIPLLTKDYQQVQDMADALRAHPIATALLMPDNGTPEASLFWLDDDGDVWRRARLDWLPKANGRRMIIADYKTTVSADPEKFARQAMNLGYHQQDAWYRDAVIGLGLAVDPAFVFVAQEKTPPYLVTVVELDATAVRIGRLLNRRAIDIYHQCTQTGEWPGYAADVAHVSFPFWYERTFEDQV